MEDIDELAAILERPVDLVSAAALHPRLRPAVQAEARSLYAGKVWQQPIRLRNRIVHGYWSIDLGILHTTADLQLTELSVQLRDVPSHIVATDSDTSVDNA
jgi:hypothetical protein